MKRDKGIYLGNSILLIKNLLNYIKKGKWLYILGSFLASFEVVNYFFMPYVLQKISSAVSNSEYPKDTVYKIILILMVLILISPIISYGTYLQKKYAQVAKGNLQKSLLAHIQRMRIADIESTGLANYVTLISGDAEKAGSLLSSYAVKSLFRFFAIYIISSIVLFLYNPEIAILSITLSLFSMAVTIILNPKVREIAREAQRISAGLSSNLTDLTEGMAIVKIYHLFNRIKSQFDKKCFLIMKKRIAFRVFNGLVDSILQLLKDCSKPLAVIYGGALLLSGESRADIIILAASMSGIMADAVQNLGVFISHSQDGLASAQRIFDVLEAELEDVTASQEDEPDFMEDEIAIRVKNLSFKYKTTEVLKRINFEIKKGQQVAIVGGSGSGKTTLFKLIQGFYDSYEGKIELGGREIKRMSKAALRNMLSYVPQEADLFDLSLKDNIAIGKASYSPEEIMSEIGRVGLLDFVESLPEKIDATIGEGGKRLSGGQRQRIAIARAMIKHAPILLLDEPTASLDPKAEGNFVNMMENKERDTTALIIAHRINTIVHADKIIVLEEGEVFEVGTHEELIKKNGRYKELYDAQFSVLA